MQLISILRGAGRQAEGFPPPVPLRHYAVYYRSWSHGDNSVLVMAAEAAEAVRAVVEYGIGYEQGEAVFADRVVGVQERRGWC